MRLTVELSVACICRLSSPAERLSLIVTCPRLAGSSCRSSVLMLDALCRVETGRATSGEAEAEEPEDGSADEAATVMKSAICCTGERVATGAKWVAADITLAFVSIDWPCPPN